MKTEGSKRNQDKDETLGSERQSHSLAERQRQRLDLIWHVSI